MQNDDPILVVDDSAAIRQTVKGVLVGMGFSNVHLASNGVEALEKCHAQSFKVVFLDWSMPVMDGLAFLKLYRSDRRNKNSAVVMLTALSGKSDILTALENGATYYVTKPVSAEVIQKKMELAGKWLSTQEAPL